MKALEQHSSTDPTFIIRDSENPIISHGVQARAKNRVLEQVRNGTDVILVTSAKHNSDPISLENYFSDNNDEIRTICLDNQSFEQLPNEQSIDLSMISAVVYESIHLDTHFAIIVDNADEIPIQALNELIKLALGINTSKNNVNFIFSGGPGLLGVVEKISDITRLSLAHCSVDIITDDDIQEFIDLKQNNLSDEQKLNFNKFVLKKITTLANGSLHTASVILEWIRLYSQYTNKVKITVGFLDELLATLDDTSLLFSYPPHDFEFTTDKQVGELEPNNENIEFVKSESLIGEDKHSSSETNTVYIENNLNDDLKGATTANVYEKVMHESDDTKSDELKEEIDLQNEDNNISSADEKQEEKIEIEIEAVAVPIEPTEVIDKISATNNELEYNDTYHIDALNNINDPLLSVDPDLPPIQDHQANPKTAHPPKGNQINKLFSYVLIILLFVAVGYYAWSNKLVDQSLLDSIIPHELLNSYQSPKNDSHNITAADQEQTMQTQAALEPQKNTLASDIEWLLSHAHQQIDDKKLTTPVGDNAFETFQFILELQPSNKEAIAGINKIKNRYALWAKLDIKDGNIKRAKYFLTLALDIDPHDRELKQTLSGIKHSHSLPN